MKRNLLTLLLMLLLSAAPDESRQTMMITVKGLDVLLEKDMKLNTDP